MIIKDKLITSDGFDEDMLLVYIGLRRIMDSETDEYYSSLGYLTYSLIGKQITNKSLTNSITSGIEKLIVKGLVSYTEDIKDMRKNEWTLNLSNLHIGKVKNKEPSEFYTVIKFDHIFTIINSTFKEKLKLLFFYCYICTTMQKVGFKVGVGFTSYKDMSAAIHISRQTISKYMDKLEDMKIIHIYRSNDAVKTSDGIKEISNTYGDIDIKDKVILVGKEFEETYGENKKIIKSTRQSRSRSASAKYNIIVNDLMATGEIRYKYEDMKEIYEILVDYNKRYKDDTFKEKKDLSIFSGYDFYGK